MPPNAKPAAGQRPARDDFISSELNVRVSSPKSSPQQESIWPFEHIGEAANRAVLLAQLRIRSAELRQVTFAVDEVGVMLASGHISPQGAIYWLWASGVDFVEEASA